MTVVALETAVRDGVQADTVCMKTFLAAIADQKDLFIMPLVAYLAEPFLLVEFVPVPSLFLLLNRDTSSVFEFASVVVATDVQVFDFRLAQGARATALDPLSEADFVK